MSGTITSTEWWYNPSYDGDFVTAKIKEGVFVVGYKRHCSKNNHDSYTLMTGKEYIAKRLYINEDELEEIFKEFGGRKHFSSDFLTFKNRATARRAREWCESVILSNKLRGIDDED